jgi:hypothetical protein
MKKIMLTYALVAFIMLGAMSVAKAGTVTFYVQVTLTDNCSPGGYHGYYCVQLNLTYYGNVVCTAQNCTVTAGTHCYAFTCNLDPIAEEPGYGVSLVAAARYPSGLCSSTTGSGSGGFYWAEMTNSSCVAYLSVTL